MLDAVLDRYFSKDLESSHMCPVDCKIKGRKEEPEFSEMVLYFKLLALKFISPA